MAARLVKLASELFKNGGTLKRGIRWWPNLGIRADPPRTLHAYGPGNVIEAHYLA